MMSLSNQSLVEVIYICQIITMSNIFIISQILNSLCQICTEFEINFGQLKIQRVQSCNDYELSEPLSLPKYLFTIVQYFSGLLKQELTEETFSESMEIPYKVKEFLNTFFTRRKVILTISFAGVDTKFYFWKKVLQVNSLNLFMMTCCLIFDFLLEVGHTL